MAVAKASLQTRASTTGTKYLERFSNPQVWIEFTLSQRFKRRHEPLLGALKHGTTCDEFYHDRPDVVDDIALFFEELTLTKASLTGMLDHVNHLVTDGAWPYRAAYIHFLRNVVECEV